MLSGCWKDGRGFLAYCPKADHRIKWDFPGIPEDVNIPPARAKRKTASPYPKNALSRASLDSMLASQGDVLALGQHGDSGELTVAAVAAAASKAAAAAAAAVVAAAGERVQAQFNVRHKGCLVILLGFRMICDSIAILFAKATRARS